MSEGDFLLALAVVRPAALGENKQEDEAEEEVAAVVGALKCEAAELSVATGDVSVATRADRGLVAIGVVTATDW